MFHRVASEVHRILKPVRRRESRNPADWGGDERQRAVNRNNHALTPNDHSRNFRQLWAGTTNGTLEARLNSLGTSLHYYQDTYSHAGYTNSIWGHLPGTHSVDKTDSDVEKAMRMAQATFEMVNAFSRQYCGCEGKWTPNMTEQVQRFAEAPGGNFITRYTNSIESNGTWYLDQKRQILGF